MTVVVVVAVVGLLVGAFLDRWRVRRSLLPDEFARGVAAGAVQTRREHGWHSPHRVDWALANERFARPMLGRHHAP